MESAPEKPGDKRKRSASPPPQPHHEKSRHTSSEQQRHKAKGRFNNPRPQNDQVRLNQLQDDERMRQWVSQEDDFVLKQVKKKAEIRIREGRSKPIDWLCRTLRLIDPTRDPLDDETDFEELEFVEPTGILENLAETQLSELLKDIHTYMRLEKLTKNVDFWHTVSILCEDYIRRSRTSRPEGRAMNSVAEDIDKLLSPKSFEDLEKLEGQIRKKLLSREPIDTDYWQQLLDSLLVWKARAKLKKVSQSVLLSRTEKLKQEMFSQASALRNASERVSTAMTSTVNVLDERGQDPDPFLQLRRQDKGLPIFDEATFLSQLAADRRRTVKLDYVPIGTNKTSLSRDAQADVSAPIAKMDAASADGHSQTTSTLYNKELARGFGEDEEIFTGEAEVDPKPKDASSEKYRLRKPRYFNRVQMGYEWNKYNQTHYDHDNPPPKVVQGYKFHIFYPDLIDKSKAPTYKIVREDGRKKGQSSAPAGGEDTCIIKFIAGPPYETIAFRIIDRDWDYSAKYDRGFKSTFESPGILTLNFSFKKIYYRK